MDNQTESLIDSSINWINWLVPSLTGLIRWLVDWLVKLAKLEVQNATILD